MSRSLERPFHPTTLVSVVQTGLRGRQPPIRMPEAQSRSSNRASRKRTAELGAANRQLLDQIQERERVEVDPAADAAAGGGRPAHLRAWRTISTIC